MICSPPPVEIIISTLQTPQVMDESLNTIATVKPENSLTPDPKLSLISLSCTKTKLLRIRRMESTDTEENVTMLFLRLLKQKQNIPILPYGML